MSIPEWLKPSLVGIAIGAVGIAIIGFAWAGWQGPESAEEMANEHARTEVVAALAPICVNQAKNDPRLAETLVRLKDVRSYERPNEVMQIGWATMPGSDTPDRGVATACMEQLNSML